MDNELNGNGVAIFNQGMYYEGDMLMHAPNGRGTLFMPAESMRNDVGIEIHSFSYYINNARGPRLPNGVSAESTSHGRGVALASRVQVARYMAPRIEGRPRAGATVKDFFYFFYFEQDSLDSDERKATMIGNILSGNLSGSWDEVKINSGSIATNREMPKYSR